MSKNIDQNTKSDVPVSMLYKGRLTKDDDLVDFVPLPLYLVVNGGDRYWLLSIVNNSLVARTPRYLLVFLQLRVYNG